MRIDNRVNRWIIPSALLQICNNVQNHRRYKMLLKIECIDIIHPDLDWYAGISRQYDTATHCPYANVYKCPRYYYSLYLLGNAGIMTKMNSVKIKDLDELWRKSDLLPVVAEHEPEIFGDNKIFSKFCPEVSFDAFRLFAFSLSRYADEIDQDAAHGWLATINNPNDWRWAWAHVEPLHYLNCPVYSQLISKPDLAASNKKGNIDAEELIEIKPGFMGISLNIRVLMTRLAKWWLFKQR